MRRRIRKLGVLFLAASVLYVVFRELFQVKITHPSILYDILISRSQKNDLGPAFQSLLLTRAAFN